MRGSAARALLTSILMCSLGASATAQVPEWPAQRPPRPLPAKDVKFPPYQVKTLPNGLQVIAVAHHEQPAVSLRLIFRVGGVQDPPDKPGVATLAAALLDQGTTTRNAEKIASTIDSVGGAIGTGSGSDLTYINAVVLKDSLDLALEMVSDLARNPSFAPEEIERQRQQILSGLKVSYEDPDYLAGVVFDRLVYGFHPYGKPDSGTPQSIASITRDDLVSYHKKWFGPNNAILAIVGDVKPEEAFAGAERVFGNWPRVESTPAKPTEPPPPTRRLVIIDRPGSVQTEIRVGNIGVPRKHPDFLALDLATKILGGEGGNRLHRVLRSERGLTYGASADLHALKDSGDVVADTDTRSETTAEALRLIVDEMWRLQRQKVHPRELADAQAYLTGSFPLTIETPSAIALQVLNAVFYGLDLSELETFRERVNAVTPEDIQRVAQQYLHPDRLSIVLVGDASVFAKQLPAVGFEQIERIGLGELDLGSPDLRRRARPMGGRLEPIAFRSLAPGPARGSTPAREEQSLGEMVGEAVSAKGGLEKLRSIKTVRTESTTYVDGPDGRVAVKTRSYIEYPDKFRVDAESPGGKVSQVFAGNAFWIQDARGTRMAPEPVAAEMRSSIERDTVKLLLRIVESPMKAKRTKATLDGRELPAIEIAGASGTPVTLIFDPATWLIAGQRYTLESPSGPLPAEETFSDYRDVNGLKVAFKAIARRQGAPRIERVLERVEYNVALDPALFAKPS